MGIAGSFSVTPHGGWDLEVVLRYQVDALLVEEKDVSLYTTVAGLFLGGAIAAVITLLSGVVHPALVFGALAVCLALSLAFTALSIRERRQRGEAKKKVDESSFQLQLGWVAAPPTSAPGTSGVSGPAQQTSSVAVYVPKPAAAAASAITPSAGGSAPAGGLHGPTGPTGTPTARGSSGGDAGPRGPTGSPPPGNPTGDSGP